MKLIKLLLQKDKELRVAGKMHLHLPVKLLRYLDRWAK